MDVRVPKLKDIENVMMKPISEFSSMFNEHTLVMLISRRKYGSCFSQKWRIFAEVHVKDIKFNKPCSIKHLIEKCSKLEIYALETAYFFPNFFCADCLPCLIYYREIPDPTNKYKKGL